LFESGVNDLVCRVPHCGPVSNWGRRSISRAHRGGARSLDPRAAPVSEDTETCLICHESLHPGIVAGWRSSRHAAVTPAVATAVEGLARKVSSGDIPDNLATVVVGCAECHTLRPGEHVGVFDHNDDQVHSVVSPGDCAVCHAVEAQQYAGNIMAHAHPKNPHTTTIRIKDGHSTHSKRIKELQEWLEERERRER